ncbi:MAG: CoA transferase [Gracilibacteraceae bacterium]|jgi:formyl-CoA transferase/CoA:oxalate CoA-transferase|nr:CoA transferase [Gracilibacteraceae bacterium]
MAEKHLLAGIKVLDLSRQLAGPFATMTMADLGAEIIKVEPAGGDDSRYWGPFVDGESCYFWSCNRGKKSIAVDLKTPAGKVIIKKLVKECDVLIENYREGVMSRLELDYDVLKEINPRLIYCHITGYGEKGPDAKRSAVDVAIQATTGLMSVTGYPDQDPVRIGVSLADLATGTFSVVGILSAYINALRTGRGQKISVSLMETMISYLVYHAQGYLSTGVIPGKHGSGIQNIEPYRAFKTRNGYITLGVGNDTNFRRLCEVIGMPEMAKDPRYLHNSDRWNNRKELNGAISDYLARQDNEEVEKRLAANDVPCGAVKNIGEVMESEQVKEMGVVVSIPHPKLGNIRMVRAPLNFSDGANYSLRHPPLLAEHTAQIMGELGYSPAEIDRLAKDMVIMMLDKGNE